MKKRILTWLTPSADQLHLWNYFGALKPMLDLEKELWSDGEFFLFLSNMHALTKSNYDPWLVKSNSMTLLKLYIACGFSPDKFFIYKQSDIPAHAQLTWILMCMTHLGFMERMHAYKDALSKGKSWDLSLWTLCYPLLMAIDILLYDTHLVPVGKDQKQHVEFARDAAQKFNHQFGDVFVLPEPYIHESVATIIWTDGRKMSKSYNNFIGLLDDEKTILKKIKKIPTSNLTIDEVKNPDQCHVYMLTKLFLSDLENQVLRKRYLAGGLSFSLAKDILYEKLIAFVQPIQEKFRSIDDADIIQLLSKNALIANEIAEKKLKKIYELVWFVL